MLKKLYHKTQPYRFLTILFCSILLGATYGHFAGSNAIKLKPLGDIFLNSMFTIVVPLIFFSVAAAIANMGDIKRVWKLLYTTLATLLFTSSIAAIFMLIVVSLFPPGHDVSLPLNLPVKITHMDLGEQLVNIFTVPDFSKLFLHDNILALILFSGLIGLATLSAGEKGKSFAAFLQSGSTIMLKMVAFIMYYAPIGFFAYFAILVGELGPKLMTTYFRTGIIYLGAAIFYFVFAFTFYAYLAGKFKGVKIFWRNIFLPAATALATCSSAASIPANLRAAEQMGVPAESYELVIPLGTIIHKDGSVLGGILKIAFMFGVLHLNFSTSSTLLLAGLIGILVGTVMGAIPSGGMIGEMLILTVYNFPPQALILIVAISLIIDAPATLLNVTSNTVCSMLVARLISGKKWLNNKFK